MKRTPERTNSNPTVTITPLQRQALRGRWFKMIRRCHRPENPDYPRYGGKNIRVYKSWRGPKGFERFLDFVVNRLELPAGVSLDAVLFPPKGGERYSLDRIDNRQGYFPSNLRWATGREQSNNQERTTFVVIDGQRLPRTEAARAANVDTRTAAHRERMGYAGPDAVSLPIGGRTAESRESRDAVVLAMIKAKIIVVDSNGFVFIRGVDGLKLARVAPVSGGRYLGVTISVPKEFHALIPVERLAARVRSGTYRDGYMHHRIVAMAHLPAPGCGGYHEVDHVSGNKQDNRPSNLRWRVPKENRPGGAGASPVAGADAPLPVNYRDQAQEEAALSAMIAQEHPPGMAPVEIQGPSLPTNVDADLVQRAVDAVEADPRYGASIWTRDDYRAILPSILAATANNVTWDGDVPVITCTNQSGAREMQVAVVQLATSYRVFFACLRCGRQAMAARTEVRNRTGGRYKSAECESLKGLDVCFPALGKLLAPDKTTGIRPHPSTVSVGSNRQYLFWCRVPGCKKALLRRPKRLAHDKLLPVCETHRQRGANFGEAGHDDAGGHDHES